MSLPKIEHGTARKNQYGRVEIIMNEGFTFYDKNDYKDFTDEEGNPREASPEEISYFRYGVFAPDTDFESRIVVVDETTMNSDQIF